ncbi:MAG: Rieske (2Fe-2S) protein [Pleurocapsa sp. MO_192.B19]|nr:Rieske (2Fe-2S) protein [Pleurocapsa sp. MO_192.B19]
MAWIKALAAETLAPGTRQIVKLEEQSLLLLNESGNIYAINNICPHLKLPLKKGKVTADGTIVCPWHRSEFDLETGEVKNWCPFPPVVGNVLGKISTEKTLGVFPTRIEDGQILVDL